MRWADLEEKKDADRKRAIGFVVGQTDWDKITDKSGHLADRALNRTKYIWGAVCTKVCNPELWLSSM